ncbi:MAG: Rdx family protein [Proteobacteria bacterium]|nr:Rdx family protein [Pseudomonadota bacterium]
MAEIKAAVGVTPELIRGDNGVFDVVADGRLVYSKDETGRFPDPGEVLNALQ